MSSSESIILWIGFAIGLLVIIAYFLLGGCILLSIIRIFVPNFLRTKEDAPQPAAAPKSNKPVIFKCPFCSYSTGTAHYIFNEFLCCSECQRHSYGDGTITGRTEEHKRLLAQEAHDCQRIAAGEYQAVINALCDYFPKPFTYNRSYPLFTFSPTQAKCSYYLPNDENKTEIITNYSPLATAAGRTALAFACVNVLQKSHPHLQFVTFHQGFHIEYH